MRAWSWVFLCIALSANAQLGTGLRLLTNKEAQLTVTASVASNVTLRIYHPPLDQFVPLLTFRSTGVNNHIDTAAPYLNSRFYASRYDAPNAFLGDHVSTTNGDLIIQPINHASFVMSWNGKMIYNDPVGAASVYSAFPKADLILISHNHSDHWSATTVNSVTNATTRIVASQGVYNQMSTPLRSITTVLTYGGSTTIFGMPVQALRATNANHLEGVNNAYVTTVGGTRILTTGDTGPTAELRALQDIDVAFVCMNIPFTMDINTAATLVRQIRPKVIYPYHYRNQDQTLANLEAFKSLVGQDLGIEVRLRKWY